MKIKTTIDKSTLLLWSIAIISAVALIFVFSQVKTDKVKNTLLEEKNIVLLFVVYDHDQPLLNEVLFYSPKTKKTAVIDVPVETGSLLKGLGRVDGLSAVFRPSEMKDYTAAIEDFLGVPIPFYLLLDLEQVEKAADLLSGLEIFISNSVEETESNPMVLLPSGSVLLDGAKVRDFVAYAEDGENSADRASRFQKFFQALMRQMGENRDLLMNEKVYSLFYGFFRTNMEEKGLKTFVTALGEADWERLVFQRVMGTDRIVDNKRLLFPHYNGNLLKETVRQVLETLGSGDAATNIGVSVSVEILNGTTRQGLATRTTQVFKSFGYDVVSVKNADDSDTENTVVIDRKDNLPQAQKAAQIIGCKRIISEQQYFNESGVDMTIVLGKDFDGRYVRNEK